jgi:hypothetical protein
MHLYKIALQICPSKEDEVILTAYMFGGVGFYDSVLRVNSAYVEFG